MHDLNHQLAWHTGAVPPDTGGLLIRNWEALGLAMRGEMGAFHLLQGEKDRRLYAILDAFAQNNGPMGVSDARYYNALKILAQAYTPIHHGAHRAYLRAARALSLNIGLSLSAQWQAINNLRSQQAETHGQAAYNKYVSGLHHIPAWFDHTWSLAPFKSYIDDAASASPFETLVALSFGYQWLVSNLLSVPLMSGAADNGDLATATVGFSLQTDRVPLQQQSLTLLRALIEQDAGNRPIVQAWIDKWFWRSYRLCTWLAMTLDYALPKRSQSWQSAWQTYAQAPLQAAFKQLGLSLPRDFHTANQAAPYLSHEAWACYVGQADRLAFHTGLPDEAAHAWLSSAYPGTYPRQQARWQGMSSKAAPLPTLCQVCRFPICFSDPAQPRQLSAVSSEWAGQTWQFCASGCAHIFASAPERYSAVPNPVLDLYRVKQSATLNELPSFAASRQLAQDQIVPGQDNGSFAQSQDKVNFAHWVGYEVEGAQ